MFLKSKPQLIAYAPIDLKLADIYIRDGYDNGTNTPTTTAIEDIDEVDIALSNMDTVVPDPAVTSGVTVKFGTDEQEYTVTARTLGSGTSEQQTIEIDDDVDGGTFTLTFGGYTTGTIAWNASAAVVQAALQALTSVGLGNATVAGSTPIWTVTFASTLANTDVALITGNGASLTSGDATDVEIAVTVAGVDEVAEVQTLKADTAMTNGDYTLSFDGETTSPIDWDLDASGVELAIESLDNVAQGEITVAAGVGTWPELNSTLTLTFSGTLLGVQPLMTEDDAGTDGVLSITETTPGVDGVAEVVTIGMNDSVTGGTFTLTETQTTAPILYSSTAAELKAALVLAIASIDSADINVTGGPGPATDWVITYTATGDAAAITVGDEDLTGGSGTAVSIVETVKGVTGTGTTVITVTPALLVATTVGGTVTFGGRKLAIKVGEGNLTFTENTPREYLKNRGLLDTVRNADEEPMDVSFDFVWEFLSASGVIPTIKETLKQAGVASTWLTTSDDACEPYCVDIEVHYDPGCGGANTEKIVLLEFRPESLEHNLKDAQISCTGKCNATEATETRGS